jgi:hypothetical protein
MSRSTGSSIGTVAVELDGLFETLRAFQGLEKDLRSEANSELRQAARACASVLATKLAIAAQSSQTRVARRVARSIRVKSDRIPVVSIGGSLRVGAGGAPAGRLAWGSEHGPASSPNRWGAPPSSGYWIKHGVAEVQRTDAVDLYRRAIVDLQIKYGLLW